MKKLLLLLLLLFSVVSCAQNPKTENVKYLKINQKMCLKKKGFTLVLKQVINDSRCPEGVTCIWAGEVSAVVSVYKNSKLIEDVTLVFSMKNKEENKNWFASYLPEKQKNIKSISVLPFPKEGSVINPKEYYIKITYLKSI